MLTSSCKPDVEENILNFVAAVNSEIQCKVFYAKSNPLKILFSLFSLLLRGKKKGKVSVTNLKAH